MRAHLVRILENLPCGVIVLDAEGAIRLANPQARALLGAQYTTNWAETRRLLRDDLNSGEREVLVGGRHLGVTCALMQDGNFAIFLLRDVSEARRSQSLAGLALLLAQEIHQPLDSMELFAGLLADSVSQHPETRQWVEHLQAGLRQASTSVNNVLEFDSQAVPRVTPTNMTRLLRETVEFVQPVARQKGMRVELAMDPMPVTISADPRGLQQVFCNLSLNAFRAMTKGGVLRITTRAADNQLRVTFSDTGCGIPAENLSRIFEERFSTNAGSPGLGLAVSRKIVEQHGGSISVTSSVGQGSEFTVALAATEEAS